MPIKWYLAIWWFPQTGVPQNYGLYWKILEKKWMIWGCPHLRKPAYCPLISPLARRRKEREPRPGEPPMRPKRALFLFDASAWLRHGLSAWSWDMTRVETEVSWNGGIPMAGWFLSWKSPFIDGWWLGVPLWLRKLPNEQGTPTHHGLTSSHGQSGLDARGYPLGKGFKNLGVNLGWVSQSFICMSNQFRWELFGNPAMI